jgi:hypothetical protein
MADAAVPIVVANSLQTSITGVGVVILGAQTGLDYPTLIAGVLGGATALSYLEPSNLLKRAFEITTASLLAGYSSPVLANVVSHGLVKYNFVQEGMDTQAGMTLVTAFIVGYLAHGVLLPGLRKIASAFIRRNSND